MLTRRNIITAVASLLLLIGQLGTVLHASEHPFHVDEVACEAFVVAEKGSAADLAVARSIAVNLTDESVVLSPVPAIRNRDYLNPQQRAPPVHL